MFMRLEPWAAQFAWPAIGVHCGRVRLACRLHMMVQ